MAVRYGFELPPTDERLLRGPLPAAARDWVRAQLGAGARIVSTHPRAGGTSSAIHAVTVDDARGTRHHLILRRYVRRDWLTEEPDLAAHEARVLTLLGPTPVDAPMLVAVDPTGDRCDVPAVLMTRIPGRVRWTTRDTSAFVDRLIDAMLAIHAVPVPASADIRPYVPYYLNAELRPPAGSSCPEDWARAIEVHGGPSPSRERVFLHRDFHPGNVLWVRDVVSGIVDWSSASLGAPEVDVGHCRINIARHLGYHAAELLTARYLERTGRDEYRPYWDLVDAVGMLDHAGPELGWLPALDEFVGRAVARLG